MKEEGERKGSRQKDQPQREPRDKRGWRTWRHRMGEKAGCPWARVTKDLVLYQWAGAPPLGQKAII